MATFKKGESMKNQRLVVSATFNGPDKDDESSELIDISDFDDDDYLDIDEGRLEDLGRPIKSTDDVLFIEDELEETTPEEKRELEIARLETHNERARTEGYFQSQMCELIMNNPEAFGFHAPREGIKIRATSRVMPDNKVLYSTWYYKDDLKHKAVDLKSNDTTSAVLPDARSIEKYASDVADQLIKEEIIRRGSTGYRLFELMGFSYEYRNGDLYVWLVN